MSYTPHPNDPKWIADLADDADDGPIPAPTAPKPERPPTERHSAGATAERRISVSWFDSARDNVPKADSLTVDELRARFKHDVENALVDVPATRDEKLKSPAFSPCCYKPNTERKGVNVLAVSAFVVDLDGVEHADVDAVFARLASCGVRAWAWTTWGNGWAKPGESWRVVVPFASDVPAPHWPAVRQRLTNEIAPLNDKATKDASRLHFIPRAPLRVPDGNGGERANDPPQWRELEGALLDPTPYMIDDEPDEPDDDGGALGFDLNGVRAIESASDVLGNRPDRVERAHRYSETCDVSVSDDGGHDTAMRVVGAVVRGFDLTDGEAHDVLTDWNTRCQPPWSVAELAHKISEAQKTPDPKGRQRGWLLNENRAAHGSPAMRASTAQEEPWPEPAPLVSRDLPTFPTQALPSVIRDYVNAVAIATETPPDLAALAVLAVLATVTHGRVEAEIKTGWREVLGLYTLGIARPGERKSAVMSAITKPLEIIEARLREEAAPAVASRKSERKILEQRVKDAETAASKANATDKATQEALALAVELERLPALAVPRLIIDDATPEAVAGVLAEQGERIALHSAEGGIFETVGGRYSDGVANLDLFLKAHCGDRYTVDRKTGDRKTLTLHRPTMTIGLMVQPDVITKITARPEFRGRGVLARFLYAWPTSRVGTRTCDPPSVPEHVEAAYCSAIKAAHARFAVANDDGPIVVHFDELARARMVQFGRELEPRLLHTGDLYAITEWANKLAGALARIAALFHLAEHDADEPITVDTLDRALSLAPFLIAHAQCVLGTVAPPENIAGAMAIMNKARQLGWEGEVTRRVIHRALESRFARADDLTAPLEHLERLGWVRLEERRGGKGGRPSAVVEFHPHTANADP